MSLEKRQVHTRIICGQPLDSCFDIAALARPKLEIEARCAIGPVGKFGKCRCLKTRSPADVQIECGRCPVQQPQYREYIAEGHTAAIIAVACSNKEIF